MIAIPANKKDIFFSLMPFSPPFSSSLSLSSLGSFAFPCSSHAAVHISCTHKRTHACLMHITLCTRCASSLPGYSRWPGYLAPAACDEGRSHARQGIRLIPLPSPAAAAARLHHRLKTGSGVGVGDWSRSRHGEAEACGERRCCCCQDGERVRAGTHSCS